LIAFSGLENIGYKSGTRAQCGDGRSDLRKPKSISDAETNNIPDSSIEEQPLTCELTFRSYKARGTWFNRRLIKYLPIN